MKNPEHLFSQRMGLPPHTSGDSLSEVGAQTPASPIQRILWSDLERLDLFVNIVVGDLR